jgi:hypothetical protein
VVAGVRWLTSNRVVRPVVEDDVPEVARASLANGR